MKINKQRLINTFCELAKIKSPSGNEDEIAEHLFGLLKKLELNVVRDNYGNIIAKLDGSGEPLIFCAHMDTVSVGSGGEINPLVGEDKITSNGTTILGADNKDSIAALIEALTVIKENNIANRSLEFVFTKEEEAISNGAKNLDFSLLSGRECIISDNADPYGEIVRSSIFCYEFRIEITGKRCHVRNPEQGINVIKIVSDSLSKIPLGKINKFTTVNIAYQVAGLKEIILSKDKTINDLSLENFNTIPDFSIILGDVRSTKIKGVEDVLDNIKNIFQKIVDDYGATMKFDFIKLADGYYFEEDDQLIVKVKNIFNEQGVKPRFIDSVGGSDANIFNAHNIKTIVVSSAHRNNHQLSEFVIIDDLVKLADFYLKFFTSIK